MTNTAIDGTTVSAMESETVSVVVVDNGYADQKAAFWEFDSNGQHVLDDNGSPVIKEVLFPSRAQIGAVNIDISGSSNGVYRLDGDAWTVGREVTEPEVIRGERYAYSDLNCVLVHNTLIKCGFGEKRIRLGTGLPFSHIYKDNQLNSSLIEKVKDSLKAEVKPQAGPGVSIITEHQVFPESTAAFVDYALDCKTGEMKIDLDVGMAVVDVGGNTTDITYINPVEDYESGEKSYSMNRERSGSKKIGVLNVRDRLRTLIQGRFNVDSLRDSQLDRALRTGSCKIFGKDELVTDEINSAKRDVVKKLMNYVEEKVGDAADLDFILFVGGGAAVLHDVISEYKHARVAERPQFANARGMLKYMTFVRN